MLFTIAVFFIGMALFALITMGLYPIFNAFSKLYCNPYLEWAFFIVVAIAGNIGFNHLIHFISQ